uniref:FADH2-dependent halogenase n=1 Tax=Streptomyces sp. CNQ-418 TaxID=467194 RepID=J7H554_9ACTN|nr:FADH2-dependent halogenase [Streptomyces sp. CNQ-418]
MPAKKTRKATRGRPAAPRETYDVAVLGAHLSGGLLAAILAHRGARVVLVDTPDDHAGTPGETTVPYTSEVFALLASRFDIPEIATFAHFTDLPDEVRTSSGVKRSLGFLYHERGHEQDPRKSVQFNVPGEHTEWHLYRPTVDAYARRIAATYGAERDPAGAPLRAVSLHDEGVDLTLEGDRELTARYVVDASGPDSPLLAAAGVSGVPSDSPHLPLRSRLLSAHLTGVRPYEQVAAQSRYQNTTDWSLGSFHHVFDGGWIEVVDFANHSASQNRHTSVTVSVCPTKFADLPDDPEAAFRALIARFPSVAGQFATASVVGSWTHAPAWQWRAERTFGRRWLAIDRAAVRAEEVLARDVTVSMELVHATAVGLLRVLRDPDVEQREFERIATYQDRLTEYNDQLQQGLRTASGHFQLLNAYLRVWLLWQILADLALKRARLECGDGPGQSWDAVEEFDSALWFRTPEGLGRALRHTFDQLAKVRRQDTREVTAAREIFAWLSRERFVPPLYRFADPKATVYKFTAWRRVLMLLWVKTLAPADFQRLLTRDNVTGRRDDAPPTATPTRSDTSSAVSDRAQPRTGVSA